MRKFELPDVRGLTPGARLDLLVSPEPNAGCWLWFGRKDWAGYGSMSIQGRSYKAHRISYELAKGPIPKGLDLDHLCRVRCCVNPDHLEAVTHAENMRRASEYMHRPAPTSVCPQGHAKEPRRECLECRRMQKRNAYHADRAAGAARMRAYREKWRQEGRI